MIDGGFGRRRRRCGRRARPRTPRSTEPPPTVRSRLCCCYRPRPRWTTPRTGSVQCYGCACVPPPGVQDRIVRDGLLTRDRIGRKRGRPSRPTVGAHPSDTEHAGGKRATRVVQHGARRRVAGIVAADACARLRRVASPPVAVTPLELGFDPSDAGVHRGSRTRSTGGCATSIRSCGTPSTSQWLISRHADVNRLLRDRRLGRTYLHQATHAEIGPARAAGLARAVPRAQRRGHAGPRAARSHAAPPAGPQGVHATDRRGDADPDPGDRRRPDRRLRRAPARSTSSPTSSSRCPVTVIAELLGIPERGPPPPPTVVGRLLPDVRARPAGGVGAQGRPGQHRVRGVPARPARRTARAGRATTSSAPWPRSSTTATR